MSDSRSESNDTLEESVTLEQNEDVDRVIFQCSQCNSVVGDSSSWTGSNEILRTISLKYVSKKVEVKDRLITSKSGTDLGSTYNLLLCGVCKSDLGRMYKTTPGYLDNMRDVYTLYVEKISSYTFGSCSQEEDGNINDIVSLPNVKKLLKELKKLQTVILSLDHRIKMLESGVHLPGIENQPPLANRHEIIPEETDMRGNRMETVVPQSKRFDEEPPRGHRLDKESLRAIRPSKETVLDSRIDMETARYDKEEMVSDSFVPDRRSGNVYRKNNQPPSAPRTTLKTDASPKESPNRGPYKRKRIA
ncbi:protein Mis18-alpha-like [Argopecten irradians]|uniref:protein Mis18-alpha-like n=1 Tax=Argopecten irradians TaxID=31199 RepID=UPI00371E499D